MNTVAEMPTKKPGKTKTEATKGDSEESDRHKPSYQCRIPTVFREGLEKLAELHGGDAADEVRTAVREYLQKHNLWPKSVDQVPCTGTE